MPTTKQVRGSGFGDVEGFKMGSVSHESHELLQSGRSTSHSARQLGKGPGRVQKHLAGTKTTRTHR